MLGGIGNVGENGVGTEAEGPVTHEWRDDKER